MRSHAIASRIARVSRGSPLTVEGARPDGGWRTPAIAVHGHRNARRHKRLGTGSQGERKSIPELPVLFSSGLSARNPRGGAAVDPARANVSKPYRLAELANACATLDKPSLV